VWPRGHRAGGHLARAQDARRRTGEERGEPNREALARGIAHLESTSRTRAAYGLTPIVASTCSHDTEEELRLVEQSSRQLGARMAGAKASRAAGKGPSTSRAPSIEVVDATDAAPPAPKYVYELEDAPRRRSGRSRVPSTARKTWLSWAAPTRILKRIRDLGYEKLPVCMAKTQLSLTDDPAIYGRRATSWSACARCA